MKAQTRRIASSIGLSLVSSLSVSDTDSTRQRDPFGRGGEGVPLMQAR